MNLRTLFLAASLTVTACVSPETDEAPITDADEPSEAALSCWLWCDDVVTSKEYWRNRHEISMLCDEYSIGDRYSCKQRTCKKTATGAVLSVRGVDRDMCTNRPRAPRPSTERKV